MRLEKIPKEFRELKIAVFDQSGLTSKLLEKRLEDNKSKVTRYLSVDEVIEKMGNDFSTVDLFIIDLDGNESEGFRLASHVRKAKVRNPEILFVSSNPKISILDCHQAGASALLPKPLDFNELRALSHHVVNRRQSLRFDVDAYPGIIKKGRRKLETKVKNIGRGGFFMEISDPNDLPEIGELINFSIDIEAFPDFSFSGEGVVRWKRKDDAERGVGVEFVNIPDEANNLIGAFVELFKIRAFVPAPKKDQ